MSTQFSSIDPADPRLAGAPETDLAAPSLQALRTVPIRVPAGSALLSFNINQERAAEQYRIVRTKILLNPQRPRMFVVSSAGPADGKTVTCLNIACALALKGETDVLVVEGDFRRPNVAKLLGLPPGPGLAEVIRGECKLEDAILRIEGLPRLFVISAGKQRDNAAELLGSARWRQICQLLRKSFEFVVLDSPPIGVVADYDLLEAVCDGVIAVVRPDHTNRSACYRALNSIPYEKRIGVVLNQVPDWFLWRSHSYSYYGSAPEMGR